MEERSSLISHTQSLPGFEHFLKSPSYDVLISVASHGPFIIINQSQIVFPFHIIILLIDSPPSIISTPSNFHDRAKQLEKDLLRIRKEKGLDTEDYNLTLVSILSDLYELVGKPVIERLQELKVLEKSQVWLCPTGAFFSLPLYAMGPILSDDGIVWYFSDLYIPSYTLSLSALIESRKLRSVVDSVPSILLVAQPDTLPGALGEIDAIETTKPGDNSHFSNSNARDRDKGLLAPSPCTFRMSRLTGDRQTVRRISRASQGQSHVASDRPISTPCR